jgi:hypothetical protein
MLWRCVWEEISSCVRVAVRSCGCRLELSLAAARVGSENGSGDELICNMAEDNLNCNLNIWHLKTQHVENSRREIHVDVRIQDIKSCIISRGL